MGRDRAASKRRQRSLTLAECTLAEPLCGRVAKPCASLRGVRTPRAILQQHGAGNKHCGPPHSC